MPDVLTQHEAEVLKEACDILQNKNNEAFDIALGLRPKMQTDYIAVKPLYTVGQWEATTEQARHLLWQTLLTAAIGLDDTEAKTVVEREDEGEENA